MKLEVAKGSFLFSNVPASQEQITENALNTEKAKLVASGPSLDEQNMKYYLYDQIYQNL